MSDQNITDYEIIYSSRKTLCLEIKIGGKIIVRAPQSTSRKKIEDFVKSHTNWISGVQARQTARATNEYHRTLSDDDILTLKSKAKKHIPPRVKYFSSIMRLFPSAVKISSAKTKFGSCSSKNSLNFSYRLMLYPPDAIDYVIVHELAHIKHHNHSKDFYALIEKYLPDYKEREKLLKQ